MKPRRTSEPTPIDTDLVVQAPFLLRGRGSLTMIVKYYDADGVFLHADTVNAGEVAPAIGPRTAKFMNIEVVYSRAE